MERTNHWSALYFIVLMTFGNYVLFNLLVAILVEGFSTQDEHKSIDSISGSSEEGRDEKLIYLYDLKDNLGQATSPVIQPQQTTTSTSRRAVIHAQTTDSATQVVAITTTSVNDTSFPRVILQESLRETRNCRSLGHPRSSLRMNDPLDGDKEEGTRNAVTAMMLITNKDKKDEEILIDITASPKSTNNKLSPRKSVKEPQASLEMETTVPLTATSVFQPRLSSYPSASIRRIRRQRLTKAYTTPGTTDESRSEVSFEDDDETSVNDDDVESCKLCAREGRNHRRRRTNSSSLYQYRGSRGSRATYSGSLREDSSVTSVKSRHSNQQEVKPKKFFFYFKWNKWMLRRENYSLFIFSPGNILRVKCLSVTEHKLFDSVILFFIALNCVTLAMERPKISPASLEREFLIVANYLFTFVFAVEMLLKVIANGLFYGADPYFKSGWNIMDGILVGVSLLDLFLSFIAQRSPRIFGMLRVFRLLRSLRPLRVINRAPGLKLVVQTLLSSLRPIGNIVLICCTFFIIFGILGVQVNLSWLLLLVTLLELSWFLSFSFMFISSSHHLNTWITSLWCFLLFVTSPPRDLDVRNEVVCERIFDNEKKWCHWDGGDSPFLYPFAFFYSFTFVEWTDEEKQNSNNKMKKMQDKVLSLLFVYPLVSFLLQRSHLSSSWSGKKQEERWGIISLRSPFFLTHTSHHLWYIDHRVRSSGDKQVEKQEKKGLDEPNRKTRTRRGRSYRLILSSLESQKDLGMNEWESETIMCAYLRPSF